MNSKPSLAQIKNDLSELKNFEVAIYGSYATDVFTSRSDIDIAIITREKNPEKNIKIWKECLGKAAKLYHINVFELLPLPVKKNIMDNHIVVFGDKLEISEYFYHFRKLWEDIKIRYYENQFSSFREKIEKMKAAIAVKS